MVRALEWSFFYFISEAKVADRVAGTICLTESEVEDFVLGKLSGEAEQRCLAHLLWCQSCQRRVDEEADFAHAARNAAAVLEQKQRTAAERAPDGSWVHHAADAIRGWFRLALRAPTGVRWATAALSLGAVFGIALLLPFHRGAEGALVALRSERGSALPVAVNGPAAAGLRLRIDVSDVAPFPAYSVAVVDATGQMVEQFTASAAGGSVNVTLHRPLAPGRYWIRLSGPAGLLREYALLVRQ